MSAVQLKVAKAYALALEAENLISDAIMADDRGYGDPRPKDLQDAWNKLNGAADELRYAMTERE